MSGVDGAGGSAVAVRTSGLSETFWTGVLGRAIILADFVDDGRRLRELLCGL
jgi:hypothetical protein